MIILVSCCNFTNDVKYLMEDIADRLSIVQPHVCYKYNFIEIDLEKIQNIRIIFVPTLQEYIKSISPDYYWTNSYEVDKYFRDCATPKCLQNFTELTNLVLQTCQEDERKGV